ncbi:MAG: GNAT family N-acetyltransferase, partial [Dichotomicrobium sp.]
VRTQIRKADKLGLSVSWGRDNEFICQFYDIFARNMRDLGTPVFPADLFVNIVNVAHADAEFGIVRLEGVPIAACLAIHGDGLTEIPSAASLRAYRKTAANSLMYWNAIERAIARGQSVFDFGRSTIGGATYVFKKKWGAVPHPVTWQYYLRRGDTQAMRPDNKKFALAIRMWQRLPVAATRVLGPMIVRGIP